VRVTIGEKGVPSEPIVIATSYGGGVAPPPPPDGGIPAAGGFDTLNDVTVAKDGTMFVTDPGYWVEPYPQANRIYRITPDGTVQVVEAFEDVPRPNGIALDRDGKHLYVGFTTPIQGTMPFIRQYIVNDDGTLGEWTKFTEVQPIDSMPDGLAVDLANNLYIATKGGIQVFKEDGSKIGDIALEEQPTGLTFGGKDMMSLYVTSAGNKIWEVKLKVPGLSQ
jgi:gluconolactonase